MNELWSFDLSTYRWIFLNTSKWHSSSPPPPPREQHAALVVGGDLYIYGGKARFFEVDGDGVVDTTSFHSDVVYSDLWRLTIPRTLTYVLKLPSSVTPVAIKQDAQVNNVLSGLNDLSIMAVSDPVDPRDSYCIEKLVVTVSLSRGGGQMQRGIYSIGQWCFCVLPLLLLLLRCLLLLISLSSNICILSGCHSTSMRRSALVVAVGTWSSFRLTQHVRINLRQRSAAASSITDCFTRLRGRYLHFRV